MTIVAGRVESPVACCRWHATGGAPGPCLIASPAELREATSAPCCPSRWNAYECEQAVGHRGMHGDRDGFTRWSDSADTRETIEAPIDRQPNDLSPADARALALIAAAGPTGLGAWLFPEGQLERLAGRVTLTPVNGASDGEDQMVRVAPVSTMEEQVST